jgi:plasmid stability protein
MHGVDLNIKDLDEAVGERLREQAAAAGLSVQQYLRNELTRIASRRSPAELAAGREPMSRSDFERIRQRLREIDVA